MDDDDDEHSKGIVDLFVIIHWRDIYTAAVERDIEKKRGKSTTEKYPTELIKNET